MFVEPDDPDDDDDDEDDEKNQALAWGNSRTAFATSRTAKTVVNFGSDMVKENRCYWRI